VTEQVIAELRSPLPYAELSVFALDRRVTAVQVFITVGLIVRYMAWKLGQCVESGPQRMGTISYASDA
jgi:hypothetical protein